MCKNYQEDKNWFYIDNRRAMVSLGPLSDKKTCPFSCAFCYVQDGFISYARKNIEDIVDFLVKYRTEYDIVYISGDTDSFAKPRTEMGIFLLQRIAQKIDCDLLFTTRTVFSDDELARIKNIVEILNQKNKKLYACISITRYSDSMSYLEPKPIPTPTMRIETLKRLHNIGAITVLAMRPFLPVVPKEDYFEILDCTKSFVDIVLGETFYFVPEGNIEKRVFLNGLPEEIESELERNVHMDFDKNNKEWTVWHPVVLEREISNYCERNGVIFSMRSSKAIDTFKNKKTSNN